MKVTVKLAKNPALYVDALVRSGIFGTSREAVIQYLIGDRLMQMVASGFLQKLTGHHEAVEAVKKARKV